MIDIETRADAENTGRSNAPHRKVWQTPMVIDAVVNKHTRFTPANAPYDCCYFSATS